MANTSNRNYYILGGLGLATIVAFLLINFFSDSGSRSSNDPPVELLEKEILELESSMLEMEIIMMDNENETADLQGLLEEKYDQITFMEQQIEEMEREGKVDKATIRDLRGKLAKSKTVLIERYKIQINELVKDNFDLVRTLDSTSLVELRRDSMYEAKYDSLLALLNDCGQQTTRTVEPPKLEDSVPILRAVSFSFESKSSENSKTKNFKGNVKSKDLHTIYFKFQLKGNELVKNSKKVLYVALEDPNGKTYSNRPLFGGAVLVSGREIVYSREADVEYIDGQPNEVSAEFTFANKKDITLGRHIVRVYHEGLEIGQARFFVR